MRKLNEILFYSFPLSFIIGNFLISLHLLLFIITSLFLIINEKLNFRFRSSYWILITFFFYFFLLTTIQFQDISSLKILLYQHPGLLNAKPMTVSLGDSSIVKSLILVRFLILIFVVDTLFFNKMLDLKKFFIFTLFCTSFVSLDVILQYITGSDLFGYKSMANKNSGPFGDEMIAGGYLQRFSFISFFSLFVILDKKNLKNPLLIFLIIVHTLAIFYAGNKMSFLLFLFGCFLTFMFIKKIRIAMFASMFAFFVIFFLTMKYDADVRGAYKSFFGNIGGLLTKSGSSNLQALDKQEIDQEATIGSSKRGYYALRGSHHYYIYHNSILVWQKQPLFGFGLKSFRIKCWENLTENSMSLYVENKNKKQLACSNHPHNYYLELLTESGILGAGLIFIFFIILWKDFFHYFIRYNRQKSSEVVLLAPIIITIFLEIWPLKSTGSFFSTGNATFLWLIVAMLLANRTKKLI